MKPSMLGLLIAAGAFGASTIYLAMQLNEERARADAVAAESRTLAARITALEKARAELEALRLAGGEMPAGPVAQVGKAAKPGINAEATAAVEPPQPDAGMSAPMGPGGRPERSEAMQKMMRAQMRANFKRLHADIGDKLGLSKDEANKLIDLMIDQQMGMAERGRQARDLPPDQRAAQYSELQKKNLAEVSSLIGAGKMDEYQAYQETIPARQEVEQLSRQLEASDSTLSTDQRARLVTALAEERKRVPQPKMSELTSHEEYTKAMSDWQDDYNQRSATRASSILNSDQQTAYNEFQQWSKEMRQQFEQRRAAREAGGGPNRGAPMQPRP